MGKDPQANDELHHGEKKPSLLSSMSSPPWRSGAKATWTSLPGPSESLQLTVDRKYAEETTTMSRQPSWRAAPSAHWMRGRSEEPSDGVSPLNLGS